MGTRPRLPVFSENSVVFLASLGRGKIETGRSLLLRLYRLSGFSRKGKNRDREVSPTKTLPPFSLHWRKGHVNETEDSGGTAAV